MKKKKIFINQTGSQWTYDNVFEVEISPAQEKQLKNGYKPKDILKGLQYKERRWSALCKPNLESEIQLDIDPKNQNLKIWGEFSGRICWSGHNKQGEKISGFAGIEGKEMGSIDIEIVESEEVTNDNKWN